MKNCFLDSPKFERTVKFEGKEICTIKYLTLLDWSRIRDKCYMDENGKITNDVDPFRLKVWQSFLSLKDWKFEREITPENVALLEPLVLDAIHTAVVKFEADYIKNKGNILKNSKGQ